MAIQKLTKEQEVEIEEYYNDTIFPYLCDNVLFEEELINEDEIVAGVVYLQKVIAYELECHKAIKKK